MPGVALPYAGLIFCERMSAMALGRVKTLSASTLTPGLDQSPYGQSAPLSIHALMSWPTAPVCQGQDRDQPWLPSPGDEIIAGGVLGQKRWIAAAVAVWVLQLTSTIEANPGASVVSKGTVGKTEVCQDSIEILAHPCCGGVKAVCCADAVSTGSTTAVPPWPSPEATNVEAR
jgi:hypothetical protein